MPMLLKLNTKLSVLSTSAIAASWLDYQLLGVLANFRLPLQKHVILTSLVLPLAFIVALASAPQAYATLPNMGLQGRPSESSAAAAPPLADQLDTARGQLRQVLDRREKQSGPHQGHYRQDFALDRQRLLDLLVDLQREKVKRIEELIAQHNVAVSAIEEDPLIKALPKTPPYSAVQVDALRDEIDGLKEKLAAADASFRANQTEIQNLHEQLKARATASRQVGERVLETGSDGKAARAREQLEVIELIKHTTEVEITVTALEQERLKLQISSWRGRIEEMQAIVAKILPAQRLSSDDLAAQRQRVHAEQEKLASEMTSMARQNAQHRIERESLGSKNKSGGLDVFRDLTLKTDNVILKGLEHLQILNSVSGVAWEKRYAILSSTDPEQRQAALQALSEIGQKLADLRYQSRTQQESLRTEIRAQRIRIDNLAGNRREQGSEKEALNLLLRQMAMDERQELAAARLGNQVSRWLTDFAEPIDQGLGGRVLWARDGAVAVGKRIWQQELFVAEDVSEVDGRKVSVKYGITVGKSIGIVILFVVGYWLLARISRFIQHQLVRRLKVSHQFASVIRRWSMIGLSLALIVVLLNLARIPLSVFAVLGGTLAIGIGFGAQNIIKNFISGLIMLFERKVRVGDVVELGGVAGYVTAVDLRATTVHAFNGVEALIPNANFIENQVINWTYSNRQVRRELTVDIAYGSDVRQAESLFLSVVSEHACILKNPAPEIYFDGFGESALKMVLTYWVEFDGPKGPRRVDSDLRHDIYCRLAAAGISIPFPQREVHVNLAQAVSVCTTN
jgi:potassium-dependent mechanosensitive channel